MSPKCCYKKRVIRHTYRRSSQCMSRIVRGRSVTETWNLQQQFYLFHMDNFCHSGRRVRGGGRLLNYKFRWHSGSVPVILQELNNDQFKWTYEPNPTHLRTLLNVDHGFFNYQYSWFEGLLNYCVKCVRKPTPVAIWWRLTTISSGPADFVISCAQDWGWIPIISHVRTKSVRSQSCNILLALKEKVWKEVLVLLLPWMKYWICDKMRYETLCLSSLFSRRCETIHQIAPLVAEDLLSC